MATIAQQILQPVKAGIFRTAFLYTGQGESTLMIIPTGTSATDYRFVLVDSDKDNEKNEIDLVRLLNDLFAGRPVLFDFINTHPHNDHIGGIKDIYDNVGIREVWHSNHKPGAKHRKKYEGLKYVIDKVGKANEFHLKGTNSVNQLRTSKDLDVINPLGRVEYIVLSPAEYLCDDIEDGTDEERDRRIHEQCGVIKFTYGKNPKSILITGDSDVTTWKNHIMYHKEKLKSTVLSASHHGSDSFFLLNDDEVYTDHLKAIDPDYVIVSAPKKADSPHGHPDDKAMKIYRNHVGEENVFHLGEKPYSIIVDIDSDGHMSIYKDDKLIAEYGNGNNDDGGSKQDRKKFTKREEVSEPNRSRFA